MTEVLRESAVPIESGRQPRIRAGETRRNREAGLRPPDSLINVLLIKDPVASAQHSALQEVVGETDSRREVFVVRIEQLRPTLASVSVAAEYISAGQSARAGICHRRIHVGEAPQRI